MLTPDQPMDPKRGSAIPEFPGGDISFVKNIPPVGTKFQDAKAMGPQGNPANYFGNDDEPIVINLNFEF